MKKITFIITGVVLALTSQAQGIYNDGAHIVCDAGTYWVLDNGNFTLTSQSATNPATMANLTINTDASLSIEPQSFLTVNGTLTNASGTDGLIIQSTLLGSGSLIHNTENVPATEQRFIGAETWNLISSPFHQCSGATAGDLSPSGGNAYLRPYTDGTGWGDYIVPTEYQLIPLQGYATWLTLSKTLSFSGSLLNGTLNRPLINGTNNWNLVGNPYPSSLDWELVDRANTSSSIYFWNNTYAGTNSGNYMTYNATGHVGVPTGTTSIIPSFQGFFVEALSAGASITFNNNSRLHSNQSFYKDYTEQSQVLVRLKITDALNRFDEILICSNPDANNDFDDFDSRKLSAGSDAPEICSMAQNEQLVINTVQALPVIIPVKIKVSQAGTFIIKAFGLLPDINTSIKLEDTQMGIITDLRSHAENFLSLSQGENSNRFYLHLGNSNSINELENNTFFTIVRNNQIYVYTAENQTINQVSLYDITGREIAIQRCGSACCLINTVNVSKGVYIIKAMIGKESVTKKVSIN